MQVIKKHIVVCEFQGRIVIKTKLQTPKAGMTRSALGLCSHRHDRTSHAPACVRPMLSTSKASQTNSLNQTSNPTAQKCVPRAPSRQLLEHFLGYLHSGTFAVYTGASWKPFVTVFAAWPAAHRRRLEHVQPAVKQQHPTLSWQNHKIPAQQRAGLQCVSPRCRVLVWGIF